MFLQLYQNSGLIFARFTKWKRHPAVPPTAVAMTEVTHPAFSPQWQSWLKCSILQSDGAVEETSKASELFHAGLCFTDSESAAISYSLFLFLLEFVFAPRTCLCLSVQDALTSIKLWHFSQITWPAISCFNTVTPKSMRVKDTIRDLSTNSMWMGDIYSFRRGDWGGRSDRKRQNCLFFHFQTS